MSQAPGFAGSRICGRVAYRILADRFFFGKPRWGCWGGAIEILGATPSCRRRPVKVRMLGGYRVSLPEVEWTSFPEAGGRDNIANYDQNARNHLLCKVSWLETLKNTGLAAF